MSQDFKARLANLSQQQLQLLALELRSRLDRVQDERREPIAVVGMGCRFPGADGPDAYWRLVSTGQDAIRETPADRWSTDEYFNADPDALGMMATRWGGFLDHIDRFDPEFFGIAPREARSMDPQQRLLLEVVWEALENAGVAPDRLRGSRTGIFVGLCSSDYFQMSVAGGYETFDTYLTTGAAHSVASGRLSYVLGLEGPAVTLDTACSSSLMAVHLAVRSLRNSESRMALAAGVNLIIWPGTTIAMSRARMMAADGRCKAFDAKGDGFVRGEGCGVVVLKRLSDAVADGDRVLAVIRGTAANQDGRSNGLTAPNGRAQTQVITDAIADAGLAPAAISYVEAHGTGTPLGDPIELHALGAALAPGRDPRDRVLVGSVKTNFGHLEAAAGIAGLIKTVLMLQAKRIAPSLHFHEPNPFIDWPSIPLDVPTSLVPWEPRSGKRVAGVSSFGLSGSNAHIILEEAPAPAVPVAPAARLGHVLAISARTDAALRELAGRYEEAIGATPALSGADLCFTANVGRAHFEHRAAIVVTDREALRDQLRAVAENRPDATAAQGRLASNEPPRVAFLFTGQGAQYAGMGRGSYDMHPVFRAAIDRCDKILAPLMGRSLVDLLFNSRPGDGQLEQPQLGQPALCALEYALACLWRSWGIEPHVMMGHSLGEYVAACLGGVLSLEESLALVVERGRLSARLPETGAMFAISVEADVLRPVIAPFGDRVCIAAINGPQNTVISGDAGAVRATAQDFAARGQRTHELPISRAFHSSHVDPILDEFEAFASRLRFSAATHQIVSTLTGELATSDVGTAFYWRRHLRQPVQFARAVQSLQALGCNVFIEMGPHPVLSVLGQHCLPDGAVTWVSTMQRDRDDIAVQLEALAKLYVSGAPVDWNAYYAGARAPRVSLPTYPFQRSRHWLQVDARPAPVARPHAVAADSEFPFPGARLSVATHDVVFEATLSTSAMPFLRDHVVYDALVVPAPVIIDMGRSAASAVVGGVHGGTIDDFVMAQPLVLQGEEPVRMQAVVTLLADGEGATFEVVSSPAGSSDWVRHAAGRLTPGRAAAPPAPLALDAMRTRLPTAVEGADYYEGLRAHGVAFGPSFRGLQRVWRTAGEALAEVRMPADLKPVSRGASLHPALLDAFFQTLGAALASDGPDADAGTYLMVGFDRCTLPVDAATGGWCHATIRPSDTANARGIVGDVRLVDDAGMLIAAVEGLRLRRAPRVALLGARHDVSRSLYEVEWVACDSPVAESAASELTAPGDISTDVAAVAATLDGKYRLDVYEALVGALESLSVEYVVAALTALGVVFVPGAQITPAQLVGRGVLPRYARLLQRLLQMLVEENVLAKTGGDTWTVTTPPIGADLPTRVRSARTRFADFQGEIDLLEVCGSRLAAVLRGEQDALELLFPSGSMARVEALTQFSPAAHAYNALVGDVMRSAARAIRTDRPLRVLEVGAGTGGTTASILEALRGRKVEYYFTDVSPLFLARAAEKFAGDPFVVYERLDVENPQTSTLYGRTFDIVVGANVIHATMDLRQSLDNLRGLMAPGALLVILEGVKKQRWVDLTFGLTEGWWRFRDEQLRTDHPLLPREAWCALLTQAGFADTTLVPERAAAIGALARQAVIVARHHPVAAPAVTTSRQAARAYLVVADDAAAGDALVSVLAGRGDAALRASAGSAGPNGWASALQKARAAFERAPTHVVYLAPSPAAPASDADELSASVERAMRPVLDLVQGIVGAASGGAPPALWIVTHGAQPGCDGDGGEDLAAAPIWGLGRTIATEHPELWGGLIDIDAVEPASGARAIAAALTVRDEDELCVRQERVYTSRLRRCAPSSTAALPTLSRDGTYLVTGGLRGLGLQVAQWLAEHGAGHLVLVARRAPDADADRAIAGMRAAGAAVTIRSVDIADETAVTALVAEIRGTLPPLRGVMHIAGIFDDRILMRQDWARFARVLAPKVRGGWLLDRLTADIELDFFVAFASGASFLAPVGLANYAAANAFIDALAHRRRRAGRPALALDWGPWAKLGMADAVGEQREQQWSSAGFSQMTAAHALDILGRLMNGAPAQVAVFDVEWDRYLATLGRRVPLYANLAKESRPQDRSVAQSPQTPELPRAMAAAAPEDRWPLLLELVARDVRHVLGFRAEDGLDPNRGLFDIGLDSLTAVELKNRLQRALGQTVPATVVFDYASVTALGKYLGARLEVAVAPPVAAPARPVKMEQPSVVGQLTTDELALRLSAKLRGAR